jgi:hypothetical protein
MDAHFPGRSFLQLFDHFFLSLHDPVQTRKIAKHEFVSNNSFVVVQCLVQQDKEGGSKADPSEFSPCSLEEIHEFAVKTWKLERTSKGKNIVFCTDPEPDHVSKSVFLIGCFLIMFHDLDHDQTFEKFSSVHDLMQEQKQSHLSILSCWRAVHRSKELGWIDFREVFDHEEEEEPDSIQMEEYLHYSR